MSQKFTITSNNIKKIINEEIQKYIIESRWAGMSINDALSFFDQYQSNTWIFFDTETLGFNPRVNQLTEIAAIAANPDGWSGNARVIGQFNEKIKLNEESVERIQRHKDMSPEERAGRGRNMTAPDVLSMTRYGESGREYLDEQDAIDQFHEFVDSFPNPVIVAQNASFDMEFISVRSSTQMKKYPVIDTMRVMQLFLIPLLRTLSTEPHNDVESAEFLEKLKRGRRYSSSMGVVSSAYGISIEGWHNALADVTMLMSLFQHVVDTLRKSSDVDIGPEHGRAVSFARRRFKR